MTHMTRRRFNTVVMGLALLSTGVFAGSARAAEPDAAAQVAALNAGLVAVGKAGKTPFDQRFAGLAPVIDRVFNVSQFLQSSVGLRWANLATAEQATLLRVFRAYTISSYVGNFSDDTSTVFKVEPGSRALGDDRIVTSDLVAPNGDITRIAYVMRKNARGAFQVVDVLINGTISQVAVQRSDFRALLAGEKDAQKLIAMLTEKVKTQSGGTVTP